MNCAYCHHEVQEDTFGYMYEEENSKRVYYHSECYEIKTGVAIA